jgi:hypothetical protein
LFLLRFLRRWWVTEEWIDPVVLNSARREQRFLEARQSNHAWLVECRDLWDAHNRDAGVYFVPCPDEAAVDVLVARCSNDNSCDRLLGIFRLAEATQDAGWRSQPGAMAGETSLQLICILISVSILGSANRGR